MDPQQTLFRTLSERALARAKAEPRLVSVKPMIDKGWMLEFGVADGDERVILNALVESGPTPKLSYSYRPPQHPDPRRRQHLERVGMLLCKALARCAPPSIPEVPREASATEDEPRQHLSFYLMGSCDRGCVFCSKTLNKLSDASVAEKEAKLRRLPLATEAVADPAVRDEILPDEIEAQLREHMHEAERYRVSWSGQDCIGSPHFDDMLRLAYGLGYREMSIQTPGSRLVEPGFLDFLSAHSVTHVALTAHARTEAMFDRVGGKVGAYRLFWDAVEQLVAREFSLAFEVPCIAETVDDLPLHLARLAELRVPINVFFWYPSSDMNDRFPHMGMPFSRAIAALDAARDHVEAGRVNVDGIPECVAPAELVAHYRWSYGVHMSFLACERLEICADCSLQETCPGAAPVYRMHYPWPESARPLR